MPRVYSGMKQAEVVRKQRNKQRPTAGSRVTYRPNGRGGFEMFELARRLMWVIGVTYHMRMVHQR